MKSTLRNTTPLLLLFGFSQMAAAQPQDAKQLLRDVQAKYASLQSYSDVGETRATITTTPVSTGGTSATAAAKPQESRTKFTIQLARPQMYRIEWDASTDFFSSKGSAWSDGGSHFVRLAGETNRPQDTETALAMATGVSGGAANTIPSIFLDLETNGIKSAENPVMGGEEAIEGEDCFVVKVHRDHIDQTFWISKASKLIRQEKMDFSGAFAPEELSHDDAKKVLESMGRTVTEDAIQALRDQMAAMQKMMKASGVQSHSSIETHREIKINDPMSPGDFREKPDPAAEKR
jgi:hypothetical protein